MTTTVLNTDTAPLGGNPTRHLPSARISDLDVVFNGPWFSDRPRPRFGDPIWEISGTDPTDAHETFTIDFEAFDPQWSLLARELVYWRANTRRARHIFTVKPHAKAHRFRLRSVEKWIDYLGTLAQFAGDLGIGMPHEWGYYETERLRDHIREHRPSKTMGNIVSFLFTARDALTSGGLNHDPTAESNAARWAGDSAANFVERSTKAIEPTVYAQVLGDALAYLECSGDILAALRWLEADEVGRPKEPPQVSSIKRPDGTTGPWRDPFSDKRTILLEARTLAGACKIIVTALTAMRPAELSRIPLARWRTTWGGADAITAPLVKDAYGEPMKWWATPPVIDACEVLEQLATSGATFLFSSRNMTGTLRDDTAHVDAQVEYAIHNFVRRINVDKSLHGFHAIDAGWPRASNIPANNSLPYLFPSAFRFTLASISNFVGLGDLALQQQLKHAQITMTHSYQANGGTGAWDDFLSAVVDAEARMRAAMTFDMFTGVWTGDLDLAGHGGREFTRTVRDLLAGLPVASYDPESDESQVEQFTTQVMTIPELAAAIRSEAMIFHPGTVVHCLRHVHQMQCGDKTSPNLGLCHPQTCANAVLAPEHQILFQARIHQAERLLEDTKIPAMQRAIIEQHVQELKAQMRTEGAGNGET